jgi:hypothetical protein
MDDVSKEVEAFIREETGISTKMELYPQTRLFEDLGQTGDDASELMVRFFKKFPVEEGNFDFHRYFLMEGEGPLYALIRTVFMRKRHRLQRHAITLGMLDQAIQDKIWNCEHLEGLAGFPEL